ncbi:hypothetical protein ACRAQ7_05115 [Erythrobacter sp. W53]|uniref:hypothetical protein n=1 Tax=Erythrobacter sp. W53 TaxID=3425947 RepID=UPI003D768F0C
MKTIIYTIPFALLVTGCAGLTDKQISRFDTMSCSQLAVALDYEERGQNEAEKSGFYNSLTSLGSKGDARFNADVAASDDDFDADNHRAARKYINERQDFLRC